MNEGTIHLFVLRYDSHIYRAKIESNPWRNDAESRYLAEL